MHTNAVGDWLATSEDRDQVLICSTPLMHRRKEALSPKLLFRQSAANVRFML